MKSGNETAHNNAINSDSEKRRAFVAPLFTAGYGVMCLKEPPYDS